MDWRSSGGRFRKVGGNPLGKGSGGGCGSCPAMVFC